MFSLVRLTVFHYHADIDHSLEAAMNQSNKDFLKLIKRSPDRGDGWRSISDQLLPLCESAANAMPDLLEFEKENSRIRLTEMGKGALFVISE